MADNQADSPLWGVRVARDQDGSGWQVDIRCVLAEGHRAVDIARTVHDRVRASLVPPVTGHGSKAALTVTVTVVRIARTRA